MFNSGISLKNSFTEKVDLCASNPDKLDANYLNTSPDNNLFENRYLDSKMIDLGQNTNLSQVFEPLISTVPNPEDVIEINKSKKVKKTNKPQLFKRV